MKLHVVLDRFLGNGEECLQNPCRNQSINAENKLKEEKILFQSQARSLVSSQGNDSSQSHASVAPRILSESEAVAENEKTEKPCSVETETTVWIRCDVYDTGIGIPGL